MKKELYDAIKKLGAGSYALDLTRHMHDKHTEYLKVHTGSERALGYIDCMENLIDFIETKKEATEK